MNDKRGILLIVLAAALWGTTGTAQALGPAGSDPVAVGVIRLAVGAPALLVVARVGHERARRPPSPWRPTLVAGTAMASYQPLFFTAVRETGVALGTVVTIGSAPLLAGLLAWMIERERPARRWWPATALGIAGVMLIAVSDTDAGAEVSGMLAALGAGLSFAFYILASRRVVTAVGPIHGTSRVFVVAASISLPLLLWVDLGWIVKVSGWVMALHLGLIATALAYVLFSLGLRSTRTATAATASLAEPMTATLLGVLLLDEVPGPGGWSGILLILVGLGLLTSLTPSIRERTSDSFSV